MLRVLFFTLGLATMNLASALAETSTTKLRFALFDDERSPSQRYFSGNRNYGAFDVQNSNDCSPAAARKWIGPAFYRNDHPMNFDRSLGRTLTAGEHRAKIQKILIDAMTALQQAGDRTIVGRHVCTGLYDYGKNPNAYSHVMGYIAIDPQLLFLLQNLGPYQADATTLIVLHEFAHQIQFWHHHPFQDDTTARRLELAADCIGSGLSAMTTLSQTGFQSISPLFVKMHNLLLDEVILALGDFQFEAEGHHGTPIERRAALHFGARAVIEPSMAQKSLRGLTMENLLNQCNRYVIERDQRYGSNWPNVP